MILTGTISPIWLGFFSPRFARMCREVRVSQGKLPWKVRESLAILYELVSGNPVKICAMGQSIDFWEPCPLTCDVHLQYRCSIFAACVQCSTSSALCRPAVHKGYHLKSILQVRYYVLCAIRALEHQIEILGYHLKRVDIGSWNGDMGYYLTV